MVTGEMYVGSTYTTLAKRIGGHLSGGRAGRKCSSLAILERGNYISYVIQKRPCNTRKEMLKLEGNWQRAYKASFGDYLVNDRIEGIFWKDSPESKAAYSREYSAQYYQTNKQKLKVQNKQRNTQPWTCPDCNKAMQYGSQFSHKGVCKQTGDPGVRQARAAYQKKYRRDRKHHHMN